MTKTMPSLNALRALDAVARHGGVRAAADHLGVVPGAVRQQMTTLEDQLGLPLFHRDRGRLTPNASGQRLADAVAVAFGIIARAAEELSSKGHRHRLRLGVPMPMAVDWLMPRMGQLQQDLSTLDVDVVPVDVRRALSEMPELDALIVGGEYRPLPDVDATPFMDDAFGPVHVPGLGVAGGPADLWHGMAALVATDVGYLWDDWFHESGQAPIRFVKRLEMADLTLALSAARHGLGVTIAPLAAVRSDIEQGRLVAPAGFSTRPVGFRFCCRMADRDQPPIASLRAWLCQVGRDEAEKLAWSAE